MNVRARILVSGKVQRTGYRDFVLEVARELDLRGFVENLRDGRVGITCEGDREDINKLVKAIKIKREGIIVDKIDTYIFNKVTDEFDHFEIKYGSPEEELREMMSARISQMRELREEIGSLKEEFRRATKASDDRVDGIGKRIEIVFQNVQALDRKYRQISKEIENLNLNLTKAVANFAVLVKEVREFIDSMRK